MANSAQSRKARRARQRDQDLLGGVSESSAPVLLSPTPRTAPDGAIVVYAKSVENLSPVAQEMLRLRETYVQGSGINIRLRR